MYSNVFEKLEKSLEARIAKIDEALRRKAYALGYVEAMACEQRNGDFVAPATTAAYHRGFNAGLIAKVLDQ